MTAAENGTQLSKLTQVSQY